jgi:DNA-binding transcriptional ArsR family regulator
MPVPRGKKVDVLRRREEVAERYIRGQTQCEIAEALGVSQPTISYDLKAIQKAWRESAIFDFNEAVGRELLRLEQLEREAWRAWERSQKPSQSAVVRGEGNNGKSAKTMRSRDGDPRFLEVIFKCSASRRALLGLDAAPPPREGGTTDVNVTVEVRRERVLGIIAALGDRERTGIPGAEPAVIESGDVRPVDERRQVETSPPPGLPGPGDHRGD